MASNKTQQTLGNVANYGGAIVAALAALAALPVFDAPHVLAFVGGLLVSVFGGHQSPPQA